jgi:hypothetical protein
MGMVWLASYPKSGNTWVRFLLANYFGGPVRHSAQVETLIPDLEKIEDPTPLIRQPGRFLVKTHTLFDLQRCREHTERAVYIVRHPKDVLLSNLNYRHLISPPTSQPVDERYIRDFIALGGDRHWLSLGFGSLRQHVESWLDRFTHPGLLVRYEDLKANPAAILGDILAFLGQPADPDRVAAAVAHSSFDQMRAMEIRERAAPGTYSVFAGAPLAGSARPRYFMNQGASRRSLAHIDPDLDREFDRAFAPLLERLGYTAVPETSAA